MKTQTYTKINTLYRRYMNLGKVELPNKNWIKFQNKIIHGEFSDPEAEYLKNLKWDCFSKIDGTNAKIVFLPSTGEIFCGGKTDNAEIEHNGLKKTLDAICERILPKMKTMFPPETARFALDTDERNQPQGYDDDGVALDPVEPYAHKTGDLMTVKLQEKPVYIYGEFFGKGVQKGGNYCANGQKFSVFDICIQGWWIPIGMLTEYCNELGLDMVPYIGQMTIPEAEKMVAAGFATLVENPSNPDYPEEGIVARPVVPVCDRRGHRMIVKIKTCDYNDLNKAIAALGPEEYESFHSWYMEHQDEIESIGKESQ